jgi:transcriptional regulator with XRE-family HTH domain
VTAGDVNRSELGEFLKARRAELSPSDVGLPEDGGTRRVAGLRREEVAELTSISVDYYTRLEQGHIAGSAPVLGAVSRALRLNEYQRVYLRGLAGKRLARARPRPARSVRRCDGCSTS